MVLKLNYADFSWYKGNLSWLKDNTIFLTKSGSHAYGTNIETSDVDIKGVAIPPLEYWIGFLNKFEQAESKDPDCTIFDIRKFFALAADCNPNIIEFLFVDESSIYKTCILWEMIKERREDFLSQKAKYTFSGYAVSQLNRIKTHKNWLLHPVENKPERKDYGLPLTHTIDKEQLKAFDSRIKKIEDTLGGEGWTKDKVEVLDEEMVTRVAEDINLNKSIIPIILSERKYAAAMRNYDAYQKWKSERNPKRAELEAKYGYDCYSDDTEFLTQNGFKKFDDISTNDLLATVYIKDTNKLKHFGTIEYQKAIDRFDSIYNGPMYHITGTHTDTLITANHKTLIQKIERKSQKESNWELVEAAHLPDAFNLMVSPTPLFKRYKNIELFKNTNIPEKLFMSIAGWYLSDGCAVFDDNNQNKAIRISQVKHGTLYTNMSKFYNKYKTIINSSLYNYERKPNGYNPNIHWERILEIRDHKIVDLIINEFGCTESKHIPIWIFECSKRLMESLLYGLISGDGSIRNHKTKQESFIYYSKSLILANDVQRVGIHCGWETALYGPYKTIDINGYESEMYQVHLRKNIPKKQVIRSQNVSKVYTTNQRIVCFTVPNGTLITRRNGKISIHGNCKHANHLVRLMRMAKEILSEGKVLVKRPDAEELLAIRSGAWSYDKLIEWVQATEKELDEIIKTTKLPHSVDRNKLDQLLRDVICEWFGISDN